MSMLKNRMKNRKKQVLGDRHAEVLNRTVHNIYRSVMILRVNDTTGKISDRWLNEAAANDWLSRSSRGIVNKHKRENSKARQSNDEYR